MTIDAGSWIRRGSLASLFATMLLHATSGFAFTAFVSNEKGNRVTVIDTARQKVIKTIEVGQRPRGTAVSNDGKEVYVCLGDDDTMLAIDTKTLQAHGELPFGPNPEILIISPQSGHIFLSNENDNLVTEIDPDTRKTLASIPVGVESEGMAISPDGKWAVNTAEATNMAHAIDLQSRKITANVLVDQRPRYVQSKHDASEIWVSAEIGGTLVIIDSTNWKFKMKLSFEVPGLTNEAIQPVGIRFTPDDKMAFVALGPANRVAVVDVASHKVIKSVLIGQRLWQSSFAPDNRHLWSTNDVSIIDVASLKVLKSIPVGSFPWGVVFSPN